eukprot:UN03004
MDDISNCKSFGWRGRTVGNACQTGSFFKSIVKTKECAVISTHDCDRYVQGIKEKYIRDKDLLMGNHYFLRGFENYISFPFAKPDKKILLLDEDINTYFSSIYDPMIASRYHYVITQRLSKLLHCN